MKHNLETSEGRQAALKEIENSFISECLANSIVLAPNVGVRVDKSYIVVGINVEKFSMDGEITLYAKNERTGISQRENEINFGTSGCFTPNNKSSYWRTIHAANFLNNWEAASEIVNKHCKMYEKLTKQIFEMLKP